MEIEIVVTLWKGMGGDQWNKRQYDGSIQHLGPTAYGQLQHKKNISRRICNSRTCRRADGLLIACLTLAVLWLSP